MALLLSRKLLSTANIPSTSSPPPLPPPQADFVLVLAALLCAIVCILALIVVARCAWLRRGTSGWNFRSEHHVANKGLKKKVFKSLPKYIHKSGGASAEGAAEGAKEEVVVDVEVEDCAICLSEYVDGEEIRVLPQCGHRFHVECIDMWLGSHSSCPSCRHILGSSVGGDGGSGGGYTSDKVRPVSPSTSASASPPPVLPF